EEARARELLQRERERIEGSLARRGGGRARELEEIDTSTNLVDDPQQIEEEAVDDAVIEQLRSELEAIERAEKRLEDGTYGLSVVSGEPIPPRRREAGPWAARTP